MDEQQHSGQLSDVSDQSDELTPENWQLKAEEYLAGWKRAQADYQNLKKESEREKSEFAKYANERLLSDLIPALDQLELAIMHVPEPDETEKSKWGSWLIGLKAVVKIWEQAAAKAGLERIPLEGSFDPNLHEPLMEIVVEGKEPGLIEQTNQVGWKLNGKVIRPAKVIISK